MRVSPTVSSSEQPLISHSNPDGTFDNNSFVRDPSALSATNIQFQKLLEDGSAVQEQTLFQVEFENQDLSRKARRSELASKNTCLTRRWQTALVTSLILLGLAGGIGGLAAWITSNQPITQPYLLYGESCYMNSRSCDATRMLWCPAGKCLCTGDFQWNSTAKNCSCGQYQIWTGFKCQDYGYYGDPCNTIPCRPTLTCAVVVNQTYTTGQDICVCNNITYLDTTTGSSTKGQCVARLTYNGVCKTKYDCQDWLGLACTNTSSGSRCQCTSTSYWNGATCVLNALGWQPCNSSVPCDTTRGLTCQPSGICDCDNYNYWDNVTTLWCQQKKTYAVSCDYDFQCNTTVNLTCPSVSTGCNCYATSYAQMCDCQAGTFWDGQRCTARHSFNGTCPGQYACISNLVCYLGHCICPGNQVWNTVTANQCACLPPTNWNPTSSTCV